MSPKPSFIATRPLTRSQTRTTKTIQKRVPKCNLQPQQTPQHLLTDLQSRLTAASSPTYATWLSRYLRNTPCRGIKTPTVQGVVHHWAEVHNLRNEYPQERLLVRKIFQSDWNEDKLAGTFYLHDIIQKQGRFGGEDVGFVEELFDEGLIQPWNTVDSFCSRVVADIAREDIDVVAGWVTAENVWRARASIVGLLRLLSEEGVKEVVLGNCAVLIRREERFAKTAVGWALREIQPDDHAAVVKFVETFKKDISLEAARNACKHMNSPTRARLLDLVKNG